MLKNKIILPLSLLSCLMVSTGVFSANTSTELAKLDKYQTPVPYAGQRNWHVTQNLGATGARAWVLGERGNSTASRELLIKSVAPGSPADGILQPYDVIVGISNKPFDSDARLAFAKALTVAEGTEANGKLELLRWRDGVTETVTVTLPTMGDYSEAGPSNCPKSQKIVTDAASFLAGNMPDGGFAGMQGGLNAMLLLATEDPQYLDHVRRTAMRMGPNHTITDAGHETWRWGYSNMFLAEYYLATGDKRVLPTIAEYCDKLAKGQCHPGTWGHRTVSDGIPPGYGSMNQSGLVCFLSMVLSMDCGVPVDVNAVKNCVEFYGRFAGWGGVPYGDHPAYNATTSNGKNGSAAVAFNLIGAEPASQWFAHMCASSHLQGFEGGHTGNYFSQIWAPIGASLAGDANYRNFWSRFNSYRDMARIPEGGFLTQSWTQIREGDLGSGHYRRGPMWSTGGFALGYLGGSKRLAVLGREKSVFGTDAPAALKPALALYQENKFDACIGAVTPLCSADDATTKAMANQLKGIAERNLKSIELTLGDIAKNMEAGDFNLMKMQVQAIESIVAKDDPRLATAYAKLAEPATEEIIGSRCLYDRLFDGYEMTKLKGFESLLPKPVNNSWYRGKTNEVARRGKGFYQKRAKAWLAANSEPAKEQLIGKPLKINPKTPSASLEFDVADPAKIGELHLIWQSSDQITVHLNDTLILSETVNGKPAKTEILLKPITLELLKQGKNTLKLSSTGGGKKLNAECQLKALMKPVVNEEKK